MYQISQLFIYPVKSLAGYEVSSALLTERGLQFDRRWMLVDKNDHFITQRDYPVMSLLQTAIENDQLLIWHKHNKKDLIALPVAPVSNTVTHVKIWDDICSAQYVSEIADEWFSNKLSLACRLVYMPETEKRKVDKLYAYNDEITSFSDGYPILMIGAASLEELNSRLASPLPVDRFRPNIVFSGGAPYDEDIMKHVVVNNIDLYGVKLCARCVITTIDQSVATKSKEPLKTLAGYRMINSKAYFGQNVLAGQEGCLNKGDIIQVISSSPRPVFNV